MTSYFAVACMIVASIVPSPSMGAEKLSAAVRTVSALSFYGTAPVYKRGYLIYRGAQDGSVTVCSTAENPPKVVFQTRIWPVGSSMVRFQGIDASPSGTIALGGTAFTGSGALSGFLAFIGPAMSQTLVQLPNTGTLAMAFANDGTLWVLVRQIDSSLNELSEYNLLRHYNTEGKLLGSFLPRSTFASITKGLSHGRASMTASDDTIGVFIDGAGVWAEVAYNGSIKGYWKVPEIQLNPGQNVKNLWMVLTRSDEVVRISNSRGTNRDDITTKVEQLNKVGNALVPNVLDSSAFPAGRPFYPYLIGSDAGELVWHVSPDKIQWTKLQ